MLWAAEVTFWPFQVSVTPAPAHWLLRVLGDLSSLRSLRGAQSLRFRWHRLLPLALASSAQGLESCPGPAVCPQEPGSLPHASVWPSLCPLPRAGPAPGLVDLSKSFMVHVGTSAPFPCPVPMPSVSLLAGRSPDPFDIESRWPSRVPSPSSCRLGPFTPLRRLQLIGLRPDIACPQISHPFGLKRFLPYNFSFLVLLICFLTCGLFLLAHVWSQWEV